MCSKNRIISLFALILGCLGASAVLAETVYQWSDEAGNVHFSDVPPAEIIPSEIHEININQSPLSDADLEKYSIINQAEQMAEWRRQLTEERLAKKRLYLEEKRLLHELELIESNEAIDAEEYNPRHSYYIPYYPNHGGHILPHQNHTKLPVNETVTERKTTNKCC